MRAFIEGALSLYREPEIRLDPKISGNSNIIPLAAIN
jgi:hypothetical protein